MLSYLEVFGLKKEFNKDELKQSLIKKIKHLNQTDLEQIDKKFYAYQLKQLYNRAKRDLEGNNQMLMIPKYPLFDNIFDRLSASNKVNGFSKSIRSQTIDGKTVVDEKISHTKDGKTNHTSKSYQIDRNGKITNL